MTVAHDFACFLAIVVTANSVVHSQERKDVIVAVVLVEDTIKDRAKLVRLGETDWPVTFKGELKLDEPLMALSQSELDLKFVNTTTDLSFTFTEVRVSCGCAMGRFSNATMLPGGFVNGRLLIKVPSGRRNQSLSLYFFNKGESVGRVDVHYDVTGFLGFDAKQEHLVFSGDAGAWQFAGGFTKPVEFNNLEISTTDSLRDGIATLNLGEKDGGFRVVYTASSAVVGNGGLSGLLTVRDRILGVEDSLVLVVEKAAPFRLSPAFLHFSRESETADLFTASALISVPGQQQVDEVDELVTMAASCKSEDVKLDVTKLSAKIWRIKLSMDSDRIRRILEEERSIDWHVGLKSGNFPAKTCFYIRE